MVVITPAAQWYGFAFYLLIIAVLLLLSRVPVGYVLRRSLLILPFVGIVAISIPFIKHGEVIGSLDIWLWHMQVTRTGLETFATILSKA